MVNNKGKKMDKISGVYKITNNITGDFYVGSSHDIKQRWISHKCPSTHKRQPNSKLYKDMAEFGLDNFKFEVLEETADLREREQYWISQLHPTYNDRQANGIDTERCKETSKRCSKEYYKIHRDKRLAYSKTYNKAYYEAHRDEHLAKSKAYCSRLCLYNGETLTLRALSKRFRRQGILHPTQEAKNYLIENTF